MNSCVGTDSLVFTSIFITFNVSLSFLSKNGIITDALPLIILGVRFTPEIITASSGDAFT